MSASEGASIDAMLVDPQGLSDEDMAKFLASADTGEQVPQDVEGASSSATEQTEQGTQDDPIEAKADGEGQKQEPQEQPAKQPEATTDERLPVLTRDGKSFIPFEALEGARKRAQKAEEQARAAMEQAEVEKGQREVLERQIREMQERTQAAETGQKPDAEATAAAEVITDEELNAFKEDAPEFYKVLKGMRDRLVSAEAKANEVAQRQEQSEAERLEQARAEVRSRVEEAVDSNPKLVYLRETAPERYNEIAALDRMLAGSKFHQNLPIAERISKAVAMYEADRGAIQLPAQPTGGQGKASAPSAAPAAKAASGPHTLSDLPGGSLPFNSEVENVDAMSVFELTNKLASLDSVEAINEYVGKLAI